MKQPANVVFLAAELAAAGVPSGRAETTDPHEMRMVRGRTRAVYTDSEGDEYIIIDDDREYLLKAALS